MLHVLFNFLKSSQQIIARGNEDMVGSNDRFWSGLTGWTYEYRFLNMVSKATGVADGPIRRPCNNAWRDLRVRPAMPDIVVFWR